MTRDGDGSCDTNEPSSEKTNIEHSAISIDPDQPKHAARAYPNRHFSPPVCFLFQESLLYTSIPLSRNVPARISLNGLRITQRPYCWFSRVTAPMCINIYA